MLTHMFLLYLSAQNLVQLYANPLYQTYAQPCPCQHNPWYPSDLVSEPTNINPYAVIPQTTTPSCKTSANNQDFVTKILSNPSIRTILDPSTKIYDQNGVEIPRNLPESCPHVINNYIIIPSEALMDKQCMKQEHGERQTNSQGRKSSYKNRSYNNNLVENNNQHRKFDMNLPNNSNGKLNHSYLRNNLMNKNERKPKVLVKNKNKQISNTESEKVISKDGVILSNNGNVIRLKINAYQKNPREEVVIQEFKRKFPGIPEQLVRSLLEYLKRKLVNGELGINNQYSNIPSISQNQRLAAIKNNPKSNSHRRNGRRRRKDQKKRNSQRQNKKCDSTKNTLTRPLDSIEKNIANENDTINIIKDPKHAEINSTQSEKLGQATHIYVDNKSVFKTTTDKSILEDDLKPDNLNLTSQFFSENSQEGKINQEENIDQVSFSTEKKEPKVNQEKTEENWRGLETTTVKSIVEDDLKPDNLHLTSQIFSENLQEYKIFQTENIDQVSVSKDKKEIELKENQEKSEKSNDQNKPHTDGYKLGYNYNKDNTILRKLGTEDVVPITVNGIFDDYYPDFKAENQYAVSNEEFPLTDSHADRYHYTTDKAFKMEELSRGRRKYEQNYNKNHHTQFSINEEKFHETENNDDKLSDKSDESTSITLTVNEESKEIIFKVPPALEIPDFETKNVKEFISHYDDASKYEPMFKYSDVLDKSSVYSDSKNQKYEKTKPAWKKDKHGGLETVFARSKVVKYGHNSDDTANVSDDGNDKYSTFVIAESYPDYVW